MSSNKKIATKIASSGVHSQATADCNQLLSEIDVSYIPSKLIDGMSLLYEDGTRINLACEFTRPLDLEDPNAWSTLERPNRQLKSVKVFINPDMVEEEIDQITDRMFKKYFT